MQADPQYQVQQHLTRRNLIKTPAVLGIRAGADVPQRYSYIDYLRSYTFENYLTFYTHKRDLYICCSEYITRYEYHSPRVVHSLYGFPWNCPAGVMIAFLTSSETTVMRNSYKPASSGFLPRSPTLNSPCSRLVNVAARSPPRAVRTAIHQLL